MPRGRRDPDEPDDEPMGLSRRESLWDDPRQPPPVLPQRMSSEELLAWYSYHIRDESIPLRLRNDMAKTLAQMLRLIGPTQVVNNVTQNSVHAHLGAPSMSTEEARAVVAKLGQRFRELPPPTPPRLMNTASTSTPRDPMSIPLSKKP